MAGAATNFPYFNGTSVFDMFDYSNRLTGDWFCVFILSGIFLVSFITLKTAYSFDRCAVASSYITTVLALILVPTGLVSSNFLLACFVLLLISVAFVWWGESG